MARSDSITLTTEPWLVIIVKLLLYHCVIVFRSICFFADWVENMGCFVMH